MLINVYGIEIVNGKPQTCSRVIAEQLNKQHKDVLRKIRSVLTEREYTQREYTYGNNNKAQEYMLDKDSFILLVMSYEGYSDFKRAYIKQFNFMEKELKNKTDLILPTQLQLAKQVVELLEIQGQLSIKAQVADKIADSDGLILPSSAGKIITGHPNSFCDWLVANKIMFRRKARLLPMARYADKYFEIKITTYEEKSREQTYFTPRGLCWVQAKYMKANNLLQLEYEGTKNV